MYKKTSFTLLTILCFAISSMTAQSNWHIGKFKVKKIDFSLGYETDYINSMDYGFFVHQMDYLQQAKLAELNFENSDFYSGVCENPSINVGLTLVHPALPSLEWRNAFAVKPNRVDAISYYNRSDYDGAYINLTGSHAEFTLESAAIFKLSILKLLNLYGGVGTNLGITNNNTTCVFTSFDLTADDISFRNTNEVIDNVPAGTYGSGDGYSDCFQTGSQLNQRAFLQVGAGLVFFKRVEIGLDIKYGVGYRADFGHSIDGTQLVATNLNLRYILK